MRVESKGRTRLSIKKNTRQKGLENLKKCMNTPFKYPNTQLMRIENRGARLIIARENTNSGEYAKFHNFKMRGAKNAHLGV